jgi:hypothetical protein
MRGKAGRWGHRISANWVLELAQYSDSESVCVHVYLECSIVRASSWCLWNSRGPKPDYIDNVGDLNRFKIGKELHVD